MGISTHLWAKRSLPMGNDKDLPVRNPEMWMKTGFGWIEIQGKVYHHDVIVHVNGAISERKRVASHDVSQSCRHTPLVSEELAFLGSEQPEVVYIGTGQYGDLPLTPEAMKMLSLYSRVVCPTPDILELLQREKRKYAAILHVTC